MQALLLAFAGEKCRGAIPAPWASCYGNWQSQWMAKRSHMNSLGSNTNMLQLWGNLHVQGIDFCSSKEVAFAFAEKFINLGQFLKQLRLLSLSACLDKLQKVGEEAGVSASETYFQ